MASEPSAATPSDKPAAAGKANGPGNLDEAFLSLIHKMHSTLEAGEILARFDAALADMVDYAGLGYESARDDWRFQRGRCGGRHHSYRLEAAGGEIGEVRFYRRAKFSAAERAVLEHLAAALLYPLRNALLYRQALQNAERDPLTGVGNRAAMDAALEREIELARRSSAPLAVILLDIDKLEPINKTHGHSGGDAMLKTVAHGMVAQIRRSDGLYRYGGDEFLLLLRNTGVPGAAALVERVRAAVANLACKHEGAALAVTVSAGVTALRADEDRKRLLQRCDQLLYAAKQAGGNRVMTAGQ